MDRGGSSRVRRRKRLRAAAWSVAARPTAREGTAGDPDLVARLEDPYRDPAAAHERLRDLRAAFEARGDRRAVFLAIYARMTGAVVDRIDRGAFADPAWVGEYLVAFANLYRAAALDYETGALGSLPDPWQLAFETADAGDALVVQDAALGVNAHINYDLALALDRVGVAPDADRKYADHRAVTGVIETLVDEAQASLVARGADGYGRIEAALGRLDDRLLVLTIDECRDSAWRTAVALDSRVGLRRRLATWLNDATATGIARLILASRASETGHDLLRDLEGTGDPDE